MDRRGHEGPAYEGPAHEGRAHEGPARQVPAQIHVVQDYIKPGLLICFYSEYICYPQQAGICLFDIWPFMNFRCLPQSYYLCLFAPNM